MTGTLFLTGHHSFLYFLFFPIEWFPFPRLLMRILPSPPPHPGMDNMASSSNSSPVGGIRESKMWGCRGCCDVWEEDARGCTNKRPLVSISGIYEWWRGCEWREVGFINSFRVTVLLGIVTLKYFDQLEKSYAERTRLRRTRRRMPRALVELQ
jgi:hypothetical protein